MTDFEKITSRDNQRLVRARKIRDGDNSEYIFVEGRRLVNEALRSNIELVECFASEEFDDQEMVEALSERGPISILSSRLLQSIADTQQPQGIVVIAKRPITGFELRKTPIDDSRQKLPLFVFLKEINNPSNLGAIVRTAEAAGVSGIITSPRSADSFSPKGLRSAMGSTFRLPIWENVSFEEATDWAKRSGMQVVATEPSIGTIYTEIDWKIPSLIVFGSEAHGLTPSEISAAGETITIQLADGVESLNLAVSAGIILFEARRQAGI
ncbi:MAG: RNA methyltransferase [Pyrinomonadaceae bacterium]